MPPEELNIAKSVLPTEVVSNIKLILDNGGLPVVLPVRSEGIARGDGRGVAVNVRLEVLPTDEAVRLDRSLDVPWKVVVLSKDWGKVSSSSWSGMQAFSERTHHVESKP